MPRPVTPQLAADIIIELEDQPGLPIVLIQRLYEPYGWAIPGGFVDVGEPVERAAEREALEETSLEVRLTALLGVYSDPARDPRGHTVTTTYVARAKGRPIAQDDAKDAAIFLPGEFPAPLAFDHELMLADYLHYRETGVVAPLR